MNQDRAAWERFWKSTGSVRSRDLDVRREFRGFYWRLLEPRLLAKHGALAGLRSIELGSGAGTLSLLLSLRGARVTLIDRSGAALAAGRALFEAHGATAEFIEGDLFTYAATAAGRFDLTVSLGTGEHFVGDERRRFWEVHRDLLAPGGLAFVSVPNAACPPYRMYMALSQRLGFWDIGIEVPYSRREVRAILDDVGGIGPVAFASSPIANDSAYFLAGSAAKLAGAIALPRSRRPAWNTRVDRTLKCIPPIPGPLDRAWGYSLVALFERAPAI
jgi:SAM-dependent methyltransferase